MLHLQFATQKEAQNPKFNYELESSKQQFFKVDIF
jgi:hypothetical protein